MDDETRAEFRKMRGEFLSIRESLDHLMRRTLTIEDRLTKIESRLTNVESRLDQIESDLSDHGQRMARLEEIAQGNRELLTGIHGILANHEERLGRIAITAGD